MPVVTLSSVNSCKWFYSSAFLVQIGGASIRRCEQSLQPTLSFDNIHQRRIYEKEFFLTAVSACFCIYIGNIGAISTNSNKQED